MPHIHDDADILAARIVETVGKRIVLGLPLGLGKAGRIANALYRRAAADPTIELDIFTALTLEPPSPSSDMERRFIGPFAERLFSGYERLAYADALRDGSLPKNITVSEFFLQAGRWLSVPAVQQSYVSANYTHAADILLRRGVNVTAQLVAKRGEGGSARYSLSSNTDITLDLLPRLERRGMACMLVAEVSAQMPFMTGEADLPASRFAHVLETPESEPSLFVLPRQPVSDADHAIGIHAASLVKDGGTLQIGIGSLGDALVAALVMRHRAPALFAQTLARLCHGTIPPDRHVRPFDKGLYAASEMFVEGFMTLHREGILKRKTSDGALVDAGFFLGSGEFYRWLREMPDEERGQFRMRGISFVNELYGEEDRKRADRTDARFVNTAMMATLLGETISDGLDDGRIVSGVGGQYNFVAQAFALEGAQSVITLNATRSEKGARRSRIVWNYGHLTIPRHLRDVFVTEYGVAQLRGRSERDCVASMVAIADQQFQPELLEKAKRAGKLEPAARIRRASNATQFIEEALEPAKRGGYCRAFPFGSDFSAVERRLLPALALLRERTATKPAMAATVLAALSPNIRPARHGDALARMGLAEPSGLSEHVYARLLAWALDRTQPME